MKVKLTLFLKEVVALETRAEAIDGLAGLADPKSDGVESSAQGSHSAIGSGSGSAVATSLLHRSSLHSPPNLVPSSITTLLNFGNHFTIYIHFI